MDERPQVDVDPSVHCLVAMIDIRGFSGFAHDENDPAAVAGYVRAATDHILSRVRNARRLVDTTIKPLGDGLLFIMNLEGETSTTAAASAEEMLRELVDVSNTFQAYLELNPPVGLGQRPTRLGIGVTYGPLVRLQAKASRPDVEFENYVGHALNLAERLQSIARRGGVLVHDEVYEKLLKHDASRRSNFTSEFSQRVDVQIRNMGTLEDAAVYATATTEILPEFLKSKAEEKTLEEFATKARLELRASSARNRTPQNQRLQVPEDTRFIFFRRDGEVFRETVAFVGGERITSQIQASFRATDIALGAGPVTDAVHTEKAVVVSYRVRWDECEDTLDSAYWEETRSTFPHAPVERLRELAMHPASILAIPLTDPRTGLVSAVAMFDNVDRGIFSDGLALEMSIKLGVLYGQLFGPAGSDGPREIEL